MKESGDAHSSFCIFIKIQIRIERNEKIKKRCV